MATDLDLTIVVDVLYSCIMEMSLQETTKTLRVLRYRPERVYGSPPIVMQLKRIRFEHGGMKALCSSENLASAFSVYSNDKGASAH